MIKLNNNSYINNNQRNREQYQPSFNINWNDIGNLCKNYISEGFKETNLDKLSNLFSMDGPIREMTRFLGQIEVTRNQLRKYYDEMIIFRDKFEMGIIDGTRLRENLELIKPIFAYQNRASYRWSRRQGRNRWH